MANIADVSYVIEGPKEILNKINEAIVVAIHSDNNKYEMCTAAEYLKLPINDETLLRGEILEEPTWNNSILEFWTEERWGLQDFAELLEEKYPEIKIYWKVEELGFEIYCTNDEEGKYFPERYCVNTCIDNIYDSEYFETEEQVYKWLDKLTYGEVKNKKDIESYNSEYNNINWINIYKFEINKD